MKLEMGDNGVGHRRNEKMKRKIKGDVCKMVRAIYEARCREWLTGEEEGSLKRAGRATIHPRSWAQRRR